MADKVLIVKKSSLQGKVKLSGAKNSALRLLAASLLTDEDVLLSNFPNGLSDVQVHNDMLRYLGKKIEVREENITISGKAINSNLIWEGRSIRNTLLILGALLSRKGYAKVPLPGGCKIGERKYDLHQLVLESLGAKVWVEEDYLCAESYGRLQGNDIYLPLRSTGATENAIISSVLASGKTTVWNPHVRPEILDLIEMLKGMGAKIEVRGNESIIINGVETLHAVTHKVIPDNMEALTYLIGAAITGGNLEIMDFPSEHLTVPLTFLKASGLKIYEGSNSVIVLGSTPFPLEISTGPYPGINSDMQPLMAVFASLAQGMSKIVDLRFPNRYAYADQLKKLGVNTFVEDNMLIIKGGNLLKGANVFADDLRAGAALLLAGLVAEGETVISNAQQIERGYDHFFEKFISLGANLRWK